MPFERARLSIGVDDYFDGEKRGETRHEYVNGNVYAMVGGSDKHGLITANLGSLLNLRLSDNCQVFISDMKVRIVSQDQEVYYYPDVLVSCDSTDREPYFRSRPCLIVEVLSPSTERLDRFEKFLFYQRLESLQEYILVAQDLVDVHLFRRSSQWRAEIFTEGDIRLVSVGLIIAIKDTYRRVFSV